VNIVQKWGELFTIASPEADRETLGCELPRNRSADIVTRADNQHDRRGHSAIAF
jgi:hypothetical protein